MTSSINLESQIALEVANLEFRYPNAEHNALNHISFSLNKGQCLGLICPNGSGKSTLLSILSGLLTPSKGDVHFQQHDALTLSQYVQNHVALVPQEYAFYQQLTVKQNLDYFVGLCGFKKAQMTKSVNLVLEQCGLMDWQSHIASTLSGGYKRKLNLAIGLLKNPTIIYLDEPTVGVDPVSRNIITSLLNQFKNDGKTIIYTSHLLSEVEDICDQIVMLDKGQAVKLDGEKACKALSIEARTSFSQACVDELRGIAQNCAFEGKKLHVVIDSNGLAVEIINTLYHHKTDIQNIHYDTPSLTQLYLNQMEKHGPSEH